MSEPTMHQRIRDRLVLLDNGLTRRDEIANHRVALEALEILFRPPEQEATDEEIDAQYENMEQAAFAVTKAARAYVKVVAGSSDLSSLVQAYTAMRDEVEKFEAMADQYERNW
jgi:hypothetical protein